MDTIEVLLNGVIDYAGLFPPASLSLPEAARNYAAYRVGKDRGALGAFVIPVARVDELLKTGLVTETPWSMNLLWTRGTVEDYEATGFLVEEEPRVRVQGIEAKAPEPRALELLAKAAGEIPLYAEFPWKDDPRPWVTAITDLGLRAKIRTGGVEAGLIPPVDRVAEFLCAVVDAAVPFKATAGLHHPVRGEQFLSYESGAPRAVMHGFLNVLLAGFFYAGKLLDRKGVVSVLEERDPGAFRIVDDEIVWRGHRASVSQLEGFRHRGMQSFGSCSFTEPLQDLRHLEML